MVQVQLLDLVARPGRAPEELQARTDAGVMGEAANRDRLTHGLPAQQRLQLGQELFEGDAVKGVAGLRLGHADPWSRQVRYRRKIVNLKVAT
jgi:hypothetical protein